MEYTPEALGTVIRSLRERHRPKLSQGTLGKEAGYGKGAGVAISRIESGDMSPGPERLAGIALVLGVNPQFLVREASSLSAARIKPVKSFSVGILEGSDERSVKERLMAVQSEVDTRTTQVTEVAEAFNQAHDRARDNFFLRFLESAARIDGAPVPPEPRGLTDEENADPMAQAAYKVDFTSKVVAQALGGVGGAAAGAAAGGAAAYATFTTAAMFGTASTGTAISGLTGVAATNATLAWLGGGAVAAGGAGVAGGTAMLAGIVAGPAALLAVGGLVWMTRRSKQKEAELIAKLDAAESELRASQHGYAALVSALGRAAGVLNYVSVHGGHAHSRWCDRVDDGDLKWVDLSTDRQVEFESFLTIAACQLAVASMNIGAFMSLRQAQLLALIEESNGVLEHARSVVEDLV